MAGDIEQMLRAIDNGEFHPYFQPLIVLRTGELYGFEILARWNHPRKGWIQPYDFIPIAEKDGWIDALTAGLLRQALSAAAALPPSLKLAVNMSPGQLRSSTLPRQIQNAAEAAGFSLSRLIIEITENALVDDIDVARSVVQQYKSMGCRLALDDFGTGYSSLLHLQSLPFDELKVDRSFVSSMMQKRESRKIVGAVVGLGQSLGLTTVAEGVETQEEADMLLWLGCELGQGWLFGKPAPIQSLQAIVAAPRHVLHTRLPTDANGRISLSTFDIPPTQRLAQLQAVYDGAPVGLAFLDCNLRYVSINRRLADMNGPSMEEHLGKTIAEAIPDIFPLIEPYLRRARHGEAIPGFEISIAAPAKKDEKRFLLSYEPARDEAGEVIGISVAVVDITALRHAEEARRESEEHFRHMMELIPQIPWIIDPEGRALDVSQRWLDITGMTDDQWRGFGWLAAVHPEDVPSTLAAMDHSFKTGQPIDLEYRVRRPGGEWLKLRARGAARVGEDGKIVCWYGCLESPDGDWVTIKP
jgi:PAS domain S-box-containing protein